MRTCKTGFMRVTFLILIFVFSPFAFGGDIIIIVSPYGGITSCPNTVKYADTLEGYAYLSVEPVTGQPPRYYLNFVKFEGESQPSVSYQFPQNEYPLGRPVTADIDHDPVEEVAIGVVKNDSAGLVICLRVFEISPSMAVSFHDIGEYRAPLSEFTGSPSSLFYSSPVIGDVDGDGRAEAVINKYIFKSDGRTKSLLDGFGTSKKYFITGTPLLIDGEGKKLVVFQALEVPDLTKPAEYSQAVYCVEVNWDKPNNVLWRAEMGSSVYGTYFGAWAELSAADLDGDLQQEIVASAATDSNYEFRVLNHDGTILKTARYTSGFSCCGDFHTRFVIAGIGEINPRVIFFRGYFGSDYWINAASSPICASLSGPANADFLVRIQMGEKAVPAWKVTDCIARITPLESPAGLPLYEPVIIDLKKDRILDHYLSDDGSMMGEAPWLAEITAGYFNGPRELSVLKVKADGTAIETQVISDNEIPPISILRDDALRARKGARAIYEEVLNNGDESAIRNAIIELNDVKDVKLKDLKDRAYSLLAAYPEYSQDIYSIIRFVDIIYDEIKEYIKDLIAHMPEISIELDVASWNIGNVKPGSYKDNTDLEGKTIHHIKNSGKIPIDVSIRYAGYDGCEPDTAPGVNRFSTSLIKGGAFVPIPPQEEAVAAKKLKVGEAVPVGLRYYAPLAISDDVGTMNAVYEFKAFKPVIYIRKPGKIVLPVKNVILGKKISKIK